MIFDTTLPEPEVKKEVVISGTKKGLGIRIVGGRSMQTGGDNESYFGIFIKEVIRNSLAEKEGMTQQLKEGFEIVYICCYFQALSKEVISYWRLMDVV